MATKTRSRAKVKGPQSSPSSTGNDKLSSHLSALVMLSQQLLSVGRFNKGIPSFISKGVDSEQLWQQLELRNGHQLALSKCTREVVQISNRKRVKREKKTDKTEVSPEVGKETEKDDSVSDSDSDVDTALDAIKDRLTQRSDDEEDGLFDFGGSSEDDLDFDFDVAKDKPERLLKRPKDNEEVGTKSKSEAKSKKKSSKKGSMFDDKFFKMADMEEFLDAEDLKEEKKIKKESRKKTVDEDDDELSDEDEEDEEIDYFSAGSDSDEAGEGVMAKYSDFFDPPDDAGNLFDDSNKENEDGKEDSDEADEDNEDGKEDSDEAGEDNEEDMEDDDDGEEDWKDDVKEEDGDGEDGPASKKKKVSFSQDLLGSDEDEKPDVKDLEKEEPKSSFEKKQEKMMQKVREMEDQSLQEPSWELTGEVSSSKRPENSLLETVLDFQHTNRAAPVITDDTTKSLEDYIKLRIKDKTFDDVERKEKPKEDVFEFKKRVVLDQEKSKQSLAEIYEQEFVKQQKKDTEEVKADPQCEKIEKEMNKLFYQLDALCNFRYVPMKPGTEVKVIVNTPAISMEEVAPVATADADLLAPEEVLAKRKGDLKASEERDATDKKRERRQKKAEKRERKKAKEAREKKVDKLKPGMGNKYSKAKALKALEDMSKADKSISLIKDGGNKLASSSAFFSQLQDEVTTNAKANKAKVKKEKKKVDAQKLML